MGQRCAATELWFPIGRIIITAKGDSPDFIDIRTPACREKIYPRNASLYSPARVSIGPDLETSLSFHRCIPMKRVGRFVFVVSPRFAFGNKHVHLGAGGIDLKLVVTSLSLAGFQEEFEDIVLPRFSIMLVYVCKEIMILELSEEIEILPIPEKLCHRRTLRLGSSNWQSKVRHRYGLSPRNIIFHSIDLGCFGSPSTHQR